MAAGTPLFYSEEGTGHPQMHHKPFTAFEHEGQIFSSAEDSRHDSVPKALPEPFRRRVDNHAGQ